MPPDPESVPLPDPPPARPAAHDAAIEAALRRFDGVDEPSVAPSRPTPWTRRPQFQLAVAASLALVVALPAVLILRDRETVPDEGSGSAPAGREHLPVPSVLPADRAEMAPEKPAESNVPAAP